MAEAEHLGQIADRLGRLGDLAERRFAAIGRSLEEAVWILAGLTATFETLLGELRGDDMAQSGQELASIAERVTAVSISAEADVANLRQLAGATEAIRERIARMHSVLQEVETLAVHARLIAATMGEAGIGFLPFAAEIRRSALAARGGVDRLDQELADARQHLKMAGDVAGTFVAQHVGTMQAITARLAAGVTSIDAHVTLSGHAASLAGVASTEIHNEVAATIVAMQLGDITRQRIEHMQSACRVLLQEAVPAAVCYRLVATQLSDTADELQRGATCVVERMHEIATDAEAIARRGNQAYGASDQESGSFLDGLEADTTCAQVLFGHLRTAHAAVSPRIATVSQAAGRLLGHVATIRSVEADIHIMGINTSLKCGRLGVAGRPLSVIAQAARDCGRQTAQHAAAVLDALEKLLTDVGTVATADSAERVASIDSTAQRMTGVVRRLGSTGQRMRQALAGLADDGAAVARLLRTAVGDFAVQHEIGTVLHDAAAACMRLAEHSTDHDAADAVLARIAAGYTMAREREAHSRVAPLLSAAPEPEAAPAGDDAVFADVLF